MSGNGTEAVGWHAIDHALHSLYPDQEPKHFATVLNYEMGGEDPLRGISAYWRNDPVPHWHFVTYGFTELFEKDKDNPDPDISGFGFELTFRLACDERDVSKEPPAWVLNFLQNLARYVFDSGNVFREGHYLNANGPIAADEATQICAIAFVRDPELSPRKTPNGSMEFLQIVGLTGDEEFALKQWATLQALDVFRKFLPLWVTDLRRASLLNDPDVRQAVAEGAKRDGSGTGRIFVEGLHFTRINPLVGGTNYVVTLGALQVPEMLTLLPLRLPFGRDFEMIGRDTTLWFARSERCSVSESDEGGGVYLNEAALEELCSVLKSQAGQYRLENFKGLMFEVEETLLRDCAGNIIDKIG